MALNYENEINEMIEKAISELQNSEFKERTNEDRLSAIGNIYFIFSNDVLKYIGQRHSKGIKQRLDQHLFGKSFSLDENGVQNGTGSKWDKVKIEIEKGNEIKFKCIIVNPESLRKTIESELIIRLNPEWNIQQN